MHDIRRFNTLTLDLCCKAVEIGNTRLRLSVGEFAMLEQLTRRPGVLYSRQLLMDVMFGEGEGDFGDRIVDSHIKRMRKQGITGIITHYGSGYCWEDRIIDKNVTGSYGSRAHTRTPEKPRLCDHCGAPIK